MHDGSVADDLASVPESLGASAPSSRRVVASAARSRSKGPYRRFYGFSPRAAVELFRVLAPTTIGGVGVALAFVAPGGLSPALLGAALALALATALLATARRARPLPPSAMAVSATRPATVAGLGAAGSASIGWVVFGPEAWPALAWLLETGLVGVAATAALAHGLAARSAAAHRRGGLRERVLLIGDAADIEAARLRLGVENGETVAVVATAPDWRERSAADRARGIRPADGWLGVLAAAEGLHTLALARRGVDGAALDDLFAAVGCPDLDLAVIDLEARDGGAPFSKRIERPTWLQTAAKRAIDIALALVCLIVLSPMLLTFAALVKATSPGPVLFPQERVGRFGRPFRIYKFRTMYAHASDATAARQVVAGDPRVTPIGRRLRAYGLDETPQLLNILRGDMSFVGPRPHTEGMLTEGRVGEDIVRGYARRLIVTPGLTGLAQVRGYRGPVHRAEQLRRRVVHDAEYVARYSIGLDLAILLATPSAVILSRQT